MSITFGIVWSFGMILYEMMALQRPFSGRHLFALSELTLQGTLPTLSEDLLERYDKIILFWKQCLSINPKDRPSVPECKQLLVHLQ
jgi:serine/threonine protein kinase